MMVRKLFFILTIFLLSVRPAVAQTDEFATAAALDTIIRVFPHFEVVDRFVDEVFKKHKKNASLATRIAKSYYSYIEDPDTKQRTYHRRDTARAFEYISKALDINAKFSKAYIVASDILYDEGRRDDALLLLDKGIAINPVDSSLYIASAKLLAYTSTEAAVAKLQLLKERNPLYCVDLQLGRLYYDLYNNHGQLPMNEMATSYGKVYDSSDRSLMNRGDYGAFSMALQWADQIEDRFSKQYEVTNDGMERFPYDFGLRQFHLNSCWALQKWEEGASTAEFMFAMPDSVKKVDAIDYQRYADCLVGIKRYDEAIAQYESIQMMENASANQKTQAENSIVRAVSAQVDELRKMGEYEKAVALVEPLVQRYRDKGKQNDNLIVAYAKIYNDWATELNGVEKQETIQKAIQIYDEAAKHSELNVGLFVYYGCQYSMVLDPDFKQGLAIPYAHNLVSMYGGKPDLASNERAFLLLGYECLLRNDYFVKKNKKGALAWAEKMLDVDSTNDLALRFISALTK